MNLSTDDGVASEYHSEEKRNLRTLVGQYAFFAEELSAQSAIVEKISGRALDAPTVDGSPSIGERYKKLLHRERENSAVLNAFLGDGRGLGIPNGKDDRRDASAGATLSEAAALRAACARALEGLREEEWSESILGSDESASLSAWLYRIVLDDAEELQAIGILFSEQAVTFLDRI